MWNLADIDVQLLRERFDTGLLKKEKHMTSISRCGRRHLTILLLGETGVGKSTWLNAFANYLSSSTLDDAMNNPIFVVPASFILVDRKYKKHRVSSKASDPNESSTAGQSATQYPRTYLFSGYDFSVRFIDTPGIGDPRGVEQDKMHLENIMNYISNFDELNAIIILLKPNVSRLGVAFRYCIMELLTRLHKDARNNIIFCFTHCRPTSFKPGDTMTTLHKMFSDERIDLPLSESNVFCTDNEAVRLLAEIESTTSLFHGGSTSSNEYERLEVSHSWTASADELAKIILYVTKIKPHLVKDTGSINDIRHSAQALAKPIEEVEELLRLNIVFNESQLSDLTNPILDPTDKCFTSSHKHTFPVFLTHSRVLCRNEKCNQLIQVGTLTQKKYVCNQLFDDRLSKKMESRIPFKKRCKTCGCKWKDHEKVNVITDDTISERPGFGKDTYQTLSNKSTAQLAIDKRRKELELRREELNMEQAEIARMKVVLSKFLQKNAILDYNKATNEYLERYIEEEETKHLRDLRHLNSLMEAQKTYEAVQRMLQTTQPDDVSKQSQTMSVEAFTKLKYSLFKLKYVGPALEELVKYAEASNCEIFVTEPKLQINLGLTPNPLQQVFFYNYWHNSTD